MGATLSISHLISLIIQKTLKPVPNKITDTSPPGGSVFIPEDMHSLPQVLERRELARSRLFSVEELSLEFSNGVRRIYERLPARGREAIIVVAIDHDNQLQLIKEYAAGFHRYQLTFPKGTAETGETLEHAAQRELREEIGVGARTITYLRRLNIAPGHMGFTIHVLLALDLYPAPLPGDEPEPLQLVKWPLSAIDQLYDCDEFDEARALAALHLAERRLRLGAPFERTATVPVAMGASPLDPSRTEPETELQ